MIGYVVVDLDGKMFEFRELNADDLVSLSKLRWEAQIEEDPSLGKELKRKFIEQCSNILEGIPRDYYIHFGAFDKEALVAMASLYRVKMIPRPLRPYDEYGYVTNVFTNKHYRGQGLGNILISCIKEWAMEQNLELLITWPSERSIPLYRRLGFENIGEPLVLKLRDY